MLPGLVKLPQVSACPRRNPCLQERTNPPSPLHACMHAGDGNSARRRKCNPRETQSTMPGVGDRTIAFQAVRAPTPRARKFPIA